MALFPVIVLAAVSGLLAQRLNLPGGLIIGAMVGAAVAQLIRGGEAAAVPGPARSVAFLVLGTTIGTTVTRETVVALRGALLPAVLAAVLIITAGVAVALVLRALGVAPAGDVLATSPGALSAVTAVAAERGAGSAEVALFHTVRVVLVLLTLPVVLALLPDP